MDWWDKREEKYIKLTKDSPVFSKFPSLHLQIRLIMPSTFALFQELPFEMIPFAVTNCN